MNTRPSWIRRPLIVALMVGLMAFPEAIAEGRGGHRGGGARRPARMSAAHRSNRAPSYRAPQMSRGNSYARANANAARAGNVQPRMNSTQPRSNSGQARVNNARSGLNGTASAASTAASLSPNSYRYGSGSNPRNYQAYGYGRGYRNRYSAGNSGYGQSQGSNRAVVSRLRSVHQSLARLDHDYRGHRARAMHQISMAVRQLSHRSMGSTTNGLANGGNNALGTASNNRRAGVNGQNGGSNRNLAANGTNRANGQNGNGGANGRRTQHLSQAQSDARLSQALRTTQGVAMQMSHQGTNSSGHGRARGHLQQAMHEMNTALTVR